MEFPYNTTDKELIRISKKAINAERVSAEEALYLFNNSPLGALAYIADKINHRINNKKVYYNKNFHIEPTNVCLFQCDFCSFSTTDTGKGWQKTHEEIIETVNEKYNVGARELHMTGGANPSFNLEYYTVLFKKLRNLFPDIHIKAFTAVEIDYLSKLESKNHKEVLSILKDAGLNSMPGGGAEIFNTEVRRIICKRKTSGEKWLEIHETAHKMGIPSNATMLYGHIENISHRIEHLELLRNLQDKTEGFNAFIPLKFRNKNNKLSHITETTLIDDIRTFAISRIFLDNFKHIKAYWPMLGKENARLMLHFGVDDLDGTIQDTTKIYSMAGSNESNPELTEDELRNLISNAGFKPIERDSLYNIL